jgi:hypothetical protein
MPLDLNEPRAPGSAGIPACNERFSAKRSSSDSTHGDAIYSMQPLTKGLFAPYGAHCGRDARAPRERFAFLPDPSPLPLTLPPRSPHQLSTAVGADRFHHFGAALTECTFIATDKRLSISAQRRTAPLASGLHFQGHCHPLEEDGQKSFHPPGLY